MEQAGGTARRVVVMATVLALAACGGDETVINMSPKLSCEQEVTCHAIAWQIGPRLLGVGGTHIKCKCGEGG